VLGLIYFLNQNKPPNHQTTMKTKTYIIAGLLAASIHASAATTQIISINFQGERSSVTGPDVTGTAGYVPADNWNNATGASGTFSNLVDSNGTSTSADVSWQVFNLWDLQNGDGNGTDQDMMSGYLDNFGASGPSDFITISGIQPNKGYDVYVYFNRGNPTYSGLTATDGTNNNTYYGFDNGSSYATNGYLLSSDDNSGDGYTTANVFLFEDYIGSTLDLDNPANPNDHGGQWKTYVQGIQIVMTVPEPSSTALLGLGLSSLLLRRRRS
jgi:hypothetical protein